MSHCQAVDRLRNYRQPQRPRRQTTTTLMRPFLGPVRRLLQTFRWKVCLEMGLVPRLWQTSHMKMRYWTMPVLAIWNSMVLCARRPVAKVEGPFVKLWGTTRIQITVPMMNLRAWTRRRIGSAVTSSIRRSTSDVRYHPLRGVFPRAI